MKRLFTLILIIGLLIPTIAPAIDFDGTEDYVDSGSGSSLDNLRTLTVSAWIYRGNTNNEEFMGKGGGEGWCLRVRGSSQNYALGFIYDWSASPWGAAYWYATTAINSGSWYHIAITYDASSTANDPVFYVNGQVDAVSFEPSSPSGSVTDDSALNFYIGSSNGVDFFTGQIDNVMIFDRALTAEEIALLYKSRLGRIAYQLDQSNLVGYWPMIDQPSGSAAAGDTVVDYSRQTNNGTATGDPVWTAAHYLTLP